MSRSPNTKQRVLVCAGARHGEQGLAMMALLAMVLVLTTLAALVLYLTGKETALAAVRLTGAQSLYAAEGGAFAGRSALMAYVNAYPQGSSSVDPSLGNTQATTWYSGGTNSTQNPFDLFNYLVTDGQKFSLSPSATSATFQVNWGSGWPHLKLQMGGAPVNAMGGGQYTASVQLLPNPQPHSSCNPPGSPCAIHQLGPTSYEIFYKYTVTSDGQVPPKFRRRVVLNGSFSVQLRYQSFSMYALFTDVHNSPTGGPVWFSSTTNFSGPVHTNGEFRFAQFPTFTDKLESVNSKAWFYNNGANLELGSPENVVGGTRVDAPLVPPDPNPQAATPANFTLGASTVPMPANSFNQQGVAVGRNPTDSSAVTTTDITSKIPELKNASSVPNGVYVPVTDKNGVCRSEATGATMLGGIYVQGTVDSLTMSLGTGSTAVYTLTQGAIQTKVTVDRANNATTVESNGWLPPPSGGSCPSGTPLGPPSRTFIGVPKGWQGPGNDNAAVIYVNGNINALSGTLQQNEQTSIVSAGSIGIAGNVLYQTPPNPSDPNSNPINVLGIYAAGGDIQIMPTAPNNVTIDAILMAGSSGSTYNSSVNVQNWNTGSPRGNVNLLGGMIEKYYGNFGTYNSTLGQQATGYGRAFTFDTRMSRGFTPPFFPTTNLFMVTGGSQPLAGVRPVWREATPP